jgi:hypothetical protein
VLVEMVVMQASPAGAAGARGGAAAATEAASAAAATLAIHLTEQRQLTFQSAHVLLVSNGGSAPASVLCEREGRVTTPPHPPRPRVNDKTTRW